MNTPVKQKTYMSLQQQANYDKYPEKHLYTKYNSKIRNCAKVLKQCTQINFKCFGMRKQSLMTFH